MAETCRSCRAPIRWARTINDKLIPVDLEPVPNGNLRLEERPGTSPRAHVEAGDTLFGGDRYISHFATCPHADEHRAPAQQHSPESVAAANAIKPMVGPLQRRVLATLREKGPCTDEQLAAWLDLGENSVRPRRIELVAAGRVTKVGTIRNARNREAALWGVAS